MMSKGLRLCHVVCILCFLAVFPLKTGAQESWGMDDIIGMYGTRLTDPIEGVWKFPGDGATIMIILSSPETYDIRLIESNALSIPPGTIIGEIRQTAKTGYYDGAIKASTLGLKDKLKGKNVIFHINESDNLCLEGYRSGYSLSLKRLFYRIFKISIEEYDERPKGLIGAKRIFPINEYHDLPVCL